jgi:hypothetical protein
MLVLRLLVEMSNDMSHQQVGHTPSVIFLSSPLTFLFMFHQSSYSKYYFKYVKL